MTIVKYFTCDKSSNVGIGIVIVKYFIYNKITNVGIEW